MFEHVLILAEHALFADAVGVLVQAWYPHAHVTALTNSHRAQACLSRQARGGLLIVDLASGNAEAQQFLSGACASQQCHSIVAFVDDERPDCELLQSVDRVLAKSASTGALAMVLRELRAAAGTLSPTVACSPRQVQVLELLHRGYSNKEIAARLRIEETTVKTHVSALLKVFGVRNRTSCAREAARLRVV